VSLASVCRGCRPDSVFEHTFQKLSFEGLEAGHPHIPDAIIPDKTGSKDPANNGYATGHTACACKTIRFFSPPSMLIGMNILSKLQSLYRVQRTQDLHHAGIRARPPPQTAPAQ